MGQENVMGAKRQSPCMNSMKAEYVTSTLPQARWSRLLRLAVPYTSLKRTFLAPAMPA